MRRRFGIGVCAVVLLFRPAIAAEAELSPLQLLGKRIFSDPTLSEPAGQSCASCHAPEAGFTSPDGQRNAKEAVLAGALAGRAGNRTPPSVAYAVFSPILHWDKGERSYVGGQFRDGRAADLVEQAKGPFLNSLEMNNPDGASVCRKVTRTGYQQDFAAIFAEKLDCAANGFERIAQALAAYESSDEVSPFSAKYDAALAGRARLSEQELRGLQLYRGPAKCERCHPSKPGPRGERPLFTDFGYENVGTPRNPANPFYRQDKAFNPDGGTYVDEGLGGFLHKPSEDGKFKTPTLRNVAAGGEGFPRAYMHNGALKSLKEVLDFYNKRDSEPGRWPAEEPRNVSHTDMGDLKLSEQDEEDIIAFLKTLTDGWKP
jgi:cytochrome c peroxidase